MREERTSQGWERLVLRVSRMVLKYALVQPAEGRASWETGFLRCKFMWQSAPVKGLRKLELAKDFFVCFLL